MCDVFFVFRRKQDGRHFLFSRSQRKEKIFTYSPSNSKIIKVENQKDSFTSVRSLNPCSTSRTFLRAYIQPSLYYSPKDGRDVDDGMSIYIACIFLYIDAGMGSTK